MSVTRSAPLVSVIIPAYQCARTLGRTLDSALTQDYPAMEVVIVDDGSTDDTPQVIARYAARDPRIRSLRQPNQGVSAARNAAIAQAAGEYLAFLDDDDEWRPGKLRRQVDILTQRPAVGLVFTDSEEVNLERGTVGVRSQHQAASLRALGLTPIESIPAAFVAGSEVRSVLLAQNCILASSVMIRADVCRQAGNFNAGQLALEDLDLWLRAARLCQFAYCSDRLAVHHRHGANISGLNEPWLNQLVAYQRLYLSAPEYAGLRAPARRGLRGCYRTLIFYYGRRGSRRQALTTYRRSQEAGFDAHSALFVICSLFGPWPFRLAGRL